MRQGNLVRAAGGDTQCQSVVDRHRGPAQAVRRLGKVPLAATGTDDALPDDVDTLKAMIVALTHRVEAAEWRAEQAEARATRAEQRADMLSRVQSRTTGIISNSKLRQERFTAVALTNLFANREAAGDPGEDGLYAVPLARIAEVTGASADTISKHISTLADNGAVRKKLKWTPERVDTTTGEILPPQRRLYLGPIGNVVDFVEAVSGLDPKRLRKNREGELVEVGTWGGAKRCPDHPQGGIVRRWTDECAECGRQLDAGEEHLDPDGVNRQVAALDPSVASHSRTRPGGIDNNDLLAADGTVAGAWLRGTSLPGMAPSGYDPWTEPPPGARP